MDSRAKKEEETSSHSGLPSEVNQHNPSNEAATSPQAAEVVPEHTSAFAEDLKSCDWDQLLERYAAAMEEHSQADEEVRQQTGKLYEAFMSWSQTTALRDEDRALKRFKTQRQYVQNSEERLEDQKKHYVEVVGAFESALALLNGGMKP